MSEAFEQAIASHRRGDIEGARTSARAALQLEPGNAALLHFLGMIEARDGRHEDARGLFEQAVAADAHYAPALVSLARLLAKAGDWRALSELRHSVSPGPLAGEFLALRAKAHAAVGDQPAAAADQAALAALTLRPQALANARALADIGRFAEAEAIYQRLLDQAAGDANALLGLTGLLESLNRPAALEPRFAQARAAGVPPAVAAVGVTIARREAGDFEGALVALDAAKGALPEASWQQMRGGLAERAGRFDESFAAFTAMNDADRAATPEAEEGIRRYRAEMDAELATLDAGAACHAGRDDRAPPLFLLGFPRSGTTLLDTFLMGHSGVQVHEERPFLEAVARSGGDPRVRSALDAAALEALRGDYWRAIDLETSRPDLLQIDKNPMASGRISLIDALFPGAPLLFMLRHPCDVVMSCYTTRFKLNWGVAAFLQLRDTVELYDRIMTVWIEARATRALNVHEVRYEELVVRPDEVLRDVAAFAGIAFDRVMLDHARTARARGHIATPSHAQVIQPLHQRSVGKWRHYRDHLAPYLPTLGKWCDRLGYSID